MPKKKAPPTTKKPTQTPTKKSTRTTKKASEDIHQSAEGEDAILTARKTPPIKQNTPAPVPVPAPAPAVFGPALPPRQSSPCTLDDDAAFAAAVVANGDPTIREWLCLPRPKEHTAPRLKFANEIFPSRISEDSYKVNQFNITACELLPSNRKLPETRESVCLTKESLAFPANLPTVTVIVCFHNEARSTLYRTVRR